VTQLGGDINILGPGGGITVGTNSRDTLAPNQEGILTLGGGSIRAFTDGSIMVNQSRIMTEQGGDIGLFSANGDISAGSGRRPLPRARTSARSAPSAATSLWWRRMAPSTSARLACAAPTLRWRR
jgi:hypothetical protein